MRVEYSKRSLSDLSKIADYCATLDNPAVGERLAARIREVVARIARVPQSGRSVVQRPGVRVAPLLRYPYLIFYAVRGDTVRILHIRHTSQRPWPVR
jgi:plasmid stabilization system protein ParE